MEIHLRTIDEEDAVFLFNGRNHDDVRKWCRQTGLLEWSGHLAWMDWQASDSSVRMFTIEGDDGENHHLIGCAGLTSINHLHQRAEFSLWVDPDSQGSGYGKKALDELLRFGFGELNLNVIWGETFSDNPAQNIFVKSGMVMEGIRREFYFKFGKRVDAVLYSITRADYLAANK